MTCLTNTFHYQQHKVNIFITLHWPVLQGRWGSVEKPEIPRELTLAPAYVLALALIVGRVDW